MDAKQAVVFVICIMLSWKGCSALTFSESPSGFASVDPNDPKYVVAFASPDASTPDWGDLKVRSRIVTQQDGSQYRCILPIENDTNIGGRADLQTKAEAVSEDQVSGEVSAQKTPFELLERAEPRCLYRLEGLWTYEMCFKKHLRQFRSDESKEAFICGLYSGDEQQTEEINVDASASGFPFKYVSHVLGKGSKCVLTGQERSAEVRFTCMRDVNGLTITGIKEFPTCNYIVTVSAPFLCSHPEFKLKADPVHVIGCYPLNPEIQQKAMAPPANLPPAISDGQASPTCIADETQCSAERAHCAAKPPPGPSKSRHHVKGVEPEAKPRDGIKASSGVTIGVDKAGEDAMVHGDVDDAKSVGHGSADDLNDAGDREITNGNGSGIKDSDGAETSEEKKEG